MAQLRYAAWNVNQLINAEALLRLFFAWMRSESGPLFPCRTKHLLFFWRFESFLWDGVGGRLVYSPGIKQRNFLASVAVAPNRSILVTPTVLVDTLCTRPFARGNKGLLMEVRGTIFIRTQRRGVNARPVTRTSVVELSPYHQVRNISTCLWKPGLL